jgi:hypothetical protein
VVNLGYLAAASLFKEKLYLNYGAAAPFKKRYPNLITIAAASLIKGIPIFIYMAAASLSKPGTYIYSFSGRYFTVEKKEILNMAAATLLKE